MLSMMSVSTVDAAVERACVGTYSCTVSIIELTANAYGPQHTRLCHRQRPEGPLVARRSTDFRALRLRCGSEPATRVIVLVTLINVGIPTVILLRTSHHTAL